MKPDENNAQIKELWVKGLTARQISVELGVTRNSVLGKLHRMRNSGLLAGNPMDERMKSMSSKKPGPSEEFNPILEREPQKLRPEPVPEPVNIFVQTEAPQPVAPPTKPIKFDKLTSKSCRFIVNRGDPKDFLFCGKVKKGRSYCDEHEKLCYYRPITKDQAK
ncbi:GcrA cell cycle regulator [uncultured Caudovirales phage]|uniref:GcrA cell cycle regulator n=1 Tax=uncultured Caudovirales phage TaxID=2100421 RepID=A0A6J7WYD9_9CAUD|nr:GcrA cell cycle regulator [uncultured Caudovirales phage]